MPSSLICSRFCGRVSLQCEAARGPSSPAMFLLLVTLRRGLQENSTSLIKAMVGLASKDSGEGLRQVIFSASGISSSGLSAVGVVQLSHLVVKCAPVLRQIEGESWVVHAVHHGALLSSAHVNKLFHGLAFASLWLSGVYLLGIAPLTPETSLNMLEMDRFSSLSLVVVRKRSIQVLRQATMGAAFVPVRFSAGFLGDSSGRLLDLGCVSGIGGVSYKPALVAFARLG
ncbi:hypothetical protein F2Q69_00005527 [Brassica cretica]|uniref:Uncharacterized protein n=1 Tax=Brassica cretica TaxID=69181 RepID=A0A8S9PGH5_BRACR|nr:hypothetical protein F2Q69_00005527 [Brassica cretica]